jgi:hypothetical protein
MSEVKHTPGPWMTRQQFANRWLIEKDQGENEAGEKLVPLGLASVHTTILEVGCSNEDTAANARLIAAAPELFEALIAIRSIEFAHSDADICAVRMQCDAVIAKATGSQS